MNGWMNEWMNILKLKIHSFIHSFIIFIFILIHSLIHSLVYSFIHSGRRLTSYNFIRSFSALHRAVYIRAPYTFRPNSGRRFTSDSFIHSFSALHRTEVRSEDRRDPHQLRSQLHQCSNLSASENQRLTILCYLIVWGDSEWIPGCPVFAPMGGPNPHLGSGVYENKTRKLGGHIYLLLSIKTEARFPPHKNSRQMAIVTNKYVPQAWVFESAWRLTHLVTMPGLEPGTSR